MGGSVRKRLERTITEKERKKEKENIEAGILNIGSKSEDWRARRLSNFSFDPFYLDEIKNYSVEGFIQGIKFPENDPRREKAFDSWGTDAKRFGRETPKERKFVWWKGETIIYGSAKHHALIERAIRAKFEQNKGAIEALLETVGMILAHDLGHPESPHTSLPAKVFCDILTKIRKENLEKVAIEMRDGKVVIDIQKGGKR